MGRVQAHPHWGTYATEADLPNVLGATVQSANLEAGDTAFVAATQRLYVCLRPNAGTASWQAQGLDAGGETLAFEWNRTSVAQFSATPDYETPGGFSAQSLAIQSNGGFPGGTALTPTATSLAAATDKVVVWLANDPLPWTSAVRRLRWEIFLREATASATNVYLGICFLADTTTPTFHGLVHSRRYNTGTTWSQTIDGGGVTSPATRAGLGDLDPGLWTCVVEVRKPAAAPPTFLLGGYGVNTVAAQVEWDSALLPALPASWDPLPLLRWGIAVVSPAAVAGSVTWRILSLRIWTEEA